MVQTGHAPRTSKADRVLIFPIFACVVWGLAMHWRRQWPAFLVVTVSVVGMVLIAMLMRAWWDKMPDAARIFTGVILWPYVLLTGAVGYYIALLPRPPQPHECTKCRYDLSALPAAGLQCPECGTPYRGRGSSKDAEPVALIPIRHGPPKTRRTL